MEKIKVLNLYSGIGGNVSLLDRNIYDITSVEIDNEIANIYKKRFPNDNVIVCDAKSYLLKHYKEFDFIWASPPCQSHSRSRNAVVDIGRVPPSYIDLTLYQIIIFLQKHFNGLYCVENVIPYYEPLIKPSYIFERHYLWCNFLIYYISFDNKINIEKSSYSDLLKFNLVDDNIFNGSDFDFSKKRQILRNCCNPLFSCFISMAFKQKVEKLKYFQLSLDI